MLFHGSQNGEPIPFIISDPSVGMATMERRYDVDFELAGVGRHIYNEWLADFCSVQPERHVGLAHLPMWDIDAAVKEATWAREHGLRASTSRARAVPTRTTARAGPASTSTTTRCGTRSGPRAKTSA